MALLRRDGEELELAGVDLALLREVRVGEIDVSAQDRVHARREPFVGNVLQLDAGLLLDERREEVAGGSERRAHRDLAWALLRIRKESWKFFHGVFGLAVSTEAVEEMRHIGSKSV